MTADSPGPRYIPLPFATWWSLPLSVIVPSPSITYTSWLCVESFFASYLSPACSQRSEPTTFLAPQSALLSTSTYSPEPATFVCGSVLVSMYVFAITSASSLFRPLCESSEGHHRCLRG